MAKKRVRKITVSMSEVDYFKLQMFSRLYRRTPESVAKHYLHLSVGAMEKDINKQTLEGLKEAAKEGVTMWIGGKQIGGGEVNI